MVVISEKSHAEHYRNRVGRPNVKPANNKETLPIRDLTAGTPCVICPSRFIGEAIEYHDMGLIDKLRFRLAGYLRKFTE